MKFENIRHKKLRARMLEHGMKQADLAEQLGIRVQCLSAKMCGDRPFTLKNALDTCDALDIPYSEIRDYFELSGSE